MKSIVSVLLSILICGISLPAFGFGTHGRVSVNNYFLKDSSGASDYNISTLRVNLRADEIAGEKSSLVLSSRSRFRAGGREYSSEIPDHRINSLYLHLGRVSENLEMDLGRLFVAGAGGARVDGFNVKYGGGDMKSAGLFAGGEPDPYVDSFNSDFFTFGGYFGHEEKKQGMALYSVTNYYRGKLDRSHIDLNGYFRPSDRTRLSNSVTVDYDKAQRRVKLTNLSIAFNTDFITKLRLHLGYNRYHPVRRFESMTYEFPENREESYLLNLSWRGLRDYFIYSGAGYRYRTFDHRDSIRYFLGGRRRDLLRSGADLELKYTYTANFTSTHQALFAELGKEFFGKLDLSGSITAGRESFDFLGTARMRYLYLVNADYIINKSIFCTVNSEYSDEEGYNSFTFFTSLSYKF